MWEYLRKLLGDNSVVKMGVISLRLATVIVGNQMQIRICMFSAYEEERFYLVWC